MKITINKAALDTMTEVFTRAGNAAQVIGDGCGQADCGAPDRRRDEARSTCTPLGEHRSVGFDFGPTVRTLTFVCTLTKAAGDLARRFVFSNLSAFWSVAIVGRFTGLNADSAMC